MKGFIEVIDEDSGTVLLNTQKIVFVCESTIMCTRVYFMKGVNDD